MRVAIVLAWAAVAALTGCGSTTTMPHTPSPTPAGPNDHHFDLHDGQGTVVGNVTLSSVDVAEISPPPSPSGSGRSSSSSPSAVGTTGVRFHVVITNLPPGSHGFHVHASGRCDGPGFVSAGPHFNPFNKRHGIANRSGPHAGDLPNLPVGADHRATIDVVNTLMSLEADRDNSLIGPGGSALVVHAKVDDEVSDPAGNSGDRIACGVISASTVASSPSPEATATSTPTPTSRRSATPSPSPSSGHGTGLEGNPAETPFPLCSSHPVPPSPCASG